MACLSRSEKTCCGLGDKLHSTEEYARHYNKIMSLFEAASSLRVNLLNIVFLGNARDEYYDSIKEEELCARISNASALI